MISVDWKPYACHFDIVDLARPVQNRHQAVAHKKETWSVPRYRPPAACLEPLALSVSVPRKHPLRHNDPIPGAGLPDIGELHSKYHSSSTQFHDF
jgi:hypothetical protein